MFGNELWKIVKDAMIVAKGTKMRTLYLTDNKADLLAVPGVTTDPMLWHNRLGHISHKGLQVLASKGLLPKVKSVETDFCENCMLGKQKRVSFSKAGRELKTEKLDLVHSDVWGPAPVQSFGGSRYYVTFIDDSTRKVWV